VWRFGGSARTLHAVAVHTVRHLPVEALIDISRPKHWPCSYMDCQGPVVEREISYETFPKKALSQAPRDSSFLTLARAIQGPLSQVRAAVTAVVRVQHMGKPIFARNTGQSVRQ